MRDVLFFQLLRTFSIVLLILSLFWFIKFTFIYIYPFMIAMCIAFLLHPIVSFVESKWSMTRGVSTFIVMGSFFTFFLTTFYLIIKQSVREAANLIETLPSYFHNMSDVLSHFGQTFITPYYDKVVETVPFLPVLDDAQLKKYVHHFIDHLNESSSVLVKNIFMVTSNLLSSITYISIVFIFIGLASFFMTKDSKVFTRLYEKIVPKKMIDELNQVIVHLKKSVLGLIRAQIIITIATSILVFIGLFLFRVNNVFSITLTVFIIDFIPYLGIGIIFMPWILYTFYTAKYVLTVQLAVLYITIIVLQQLIEPKILAVNIGIHPLVAIVILFFGLQRFGVLGIFLTPIVLIVISAVYRAGIVHYVANYIRNG